MRCSDGFFLFLQQRTVYAQPTTLHSCSPSMSSSAAAASPPPFFPSPLFWQSPPSLCPPPPPTCFFPLHSSRPATCSSRARINQERKIRRSDCKWEGSRWWLELKNVQNMSEWQLKKWGGGLKIKGENEKDGLLQQAALKKRRRRRKLAHSDGRSSPQLLWGQKFTVALISPFCSQSEHGSGCWGEFWPTLKNVLYCQPPPFSSHHSPLFWFLRTHLFHKGICESYLVEDN